MDRKLEAPTVGTKPPVAGRYQIERVLGRGGMGVVYVAFDLELRRRVALKVPHAPVPLDERSLARFHREARAAAALSHPGVVTVFDAFIDNGAPYIVMELVPGVSLAEELRARSPLPVPRAAAIGRAVAEALAFAHRHGVVHRDVKPANVMLTPSGGIKVLDFGVARLVAATVPTDPRTPAGTVEYLSPEQIRNAAADVRSDLYALGVVEFEMLTGRAPFVGNPAAVMYQHLEQPPAPPSSLRDDVPEGLDAVVVRCLAKDPALRYQRAEDVADALAPFAEHSPVTEGSPDAAVTPVPTPSTERPSTASAASAPTVALADAPATAPDAPQSHPSPTVPLPPVPVDPPLPPGRTPRARRRGRWMVATAAVLALLTATAWVEVRWHPVSFGAAKAAPKAPPTLFAPATVRAHGECNGLFAFRATVSWTPTRTRSANGYLVYRGATSTGRFHAIAPISGRMTTRYVDTGLGSGSTYWYEVRAVDGARVGPKSNPASADTPLLCLG